MRRARAASEDEEQQGRRLRRHVAPAVEATAAEAAVAPQATDQQQQQQQVHVQPGHADGADDEPEPENEEQDSDYDEGEQSENGGEEETEDEDEDPDDREVDDEEGEDEDDDPYFDDGDAGIIRIPGPGDYDTVIGAPVGAPARAAGTSPQVNPATDTEIAPGVYARQEPDGYHCLFGSPLRNIPKMLSKVFQMRQQQGQLLWKSSIALSDWEWRYIKDALGHERIRPLLQTGQRVLKPLPESGFPPRLRPKDSSGGPLRGPHVSRNSGKPWNVGRQYFSSFRSGDFSGFMWADGVGAMEAEAQESFTAYMGDEGGLFGLF